MTMLAKSVGITALLWAVSLPAVAQHVADRTVQLPDPHVQGFYFVADDLVLATEFKDKDVIFNAYDPGRAAALWRQQFRVRDSDKSPGSVIHIAPSQDRIYLGNGPLTVIDPATGHTLWSLDCKTIGSFNFSGAHFFADSSFLIVGTEGCGNTEKLQLLSVNGVTGAVRWRAPARAHTYKIGNIEHWDFDLSGWYAGAAPELNDSTLAPPPDRFVVEGERLFAIDYATGRQAWGLRDEPGRNLPISSGILSLWIKDDKLNAYNKRTGLLQWTFDLKAPWAEASLANPADPAGSDIMLFTYHDAFRLDPATGQAKWSVRRGEDGWGQLNSPQLVVLARKGHDWDGLDPATGQPKWHISISDRHWRRADPDWSVAATGIVLFAAFEHSGDIGPWTLWGIDAATGKELWKLDRALDEDIDEYLVLGGTVISVQTSNGWGEVDPRTGAVTPTVIREKARHRRNDSFNVGHGLSYSKKAKTLTYRGTDGHVVWIRAGEESENAGTAVVHNVVVWPRQDGKVELIALASGNTLQTISGNSKPVIGVDQDGGRVLIPEGSKLHIVSISQ